MKVEKGFDRKLVIAAANQRDVVFPPTPKETSFCRCLHGYSVRIVPVWDGLRSSLFIGHAEFLEVMNLNGCAPSIFAANLNPRRFAAYLMAIEY